MTFKVAISQGGAPSPAKVPIGDLAAAPDQTENNGGTYEGWLDATIERGMGEFAHKITLKYMDRWAQEAQPWPIRTGDSIVPSWDGQPYTAGWVDVSRKSVSADEWGLSIVARSFTGDLVDCSAVHETGHWTNATALTIAKAVCAKYGIDVKCDNPGDPIPRFTIRQGESVNDLLTRLGKIRSLIPLTTPDGQVELYSIESSLDLGASTPILPLAVEESLSRDHVDDATMRHSEYLLHSTGIDDAEDAFANATAVDLEVKRFRPLVVVSDQGANRAQMETRALWEANVRAARGEQLVYVFQSPLNIAGRLYRPGQRYRVTDDAYGVDTPLLLHRCVDRPAQMRFELSFVHPEAYARYPVVGKARKKLVRVSKRPKRTRRPSL